MSDKKKAPAASSLAIQIGKKLVLNDAEIAQLEEVKNGTRQLKDSEIPIVAEKIMSIHNNSLYMFDHLAGEILLDYVAGGKSNRLHPQKSEAGDEEKATEAKASLKKLHTHLVDHHKYTKSMNTFYSYARVAECDREFAGTLTPEQQKQYAALDFTSRRAIAYSAADELKLRAFEFAITAPNFSTRKLDLFIAEQKVLLIGDGASDPDAEKAKLEKEAAKEQARLDREAAKEQKRLDREAAKEEAKKEAKYNKEEAEKEERIKAIDFKTLKNVTPEIIRLPDVLLTTAGKAFISDEKLKSLSVPQKKKALEAAEQQAAELRIDIANNNEKIKALNKTLSGMSDYQKSEEIRIKAEAKEAIDELSKSIKAEIKAIKTTIDESMKLKKKAEEQHEEYEKLTQKLS